MSREENIAVQLEKILAIVAKHKDGFSKFKSILSRDPSFCAHTLAYIEEHFTSSLEKDLAECWEQILNFRRDLYTLGLAQKAGEIEEGGTFRQFRPKDISRELRRAVGELGFSAEALEFCRRVKCEFAHEIVKHNEAFLRDLCFKYKINSEIIQEIKKKLRQRGLKLGMRVI